MAVAETMLRGDSFDVNHRSKRAISGVMRQRQVVTYKVLRRRESFAAS
jgi:hypothetical protein